MRRLRLENVFRKENQARGENKRRSPATNPGGTPPAEPSQPEQTATPQVCHHGRTSTASSVLAGTPPVPPPTTVPLGASAFPNRPGFTPQSRCCRRNVRSSPGVRMEVQRGSWSGRLHLQAFRKVAQRSSCR